MEDFLIAARTLHFAAAITLTGVLAFERLVAGPAFRHSGAVAVTGSAAGLRRRLGWLAWTSLALALVSGAAWLVAVAAGMSGKPLGVALSQGAVTVVLTRTRFGEDWLLRLALAVLLGLCLKRHRRRAGGALRWTALLLAAVMLASLAWAGHGAATPGPPGDLHLAADILHLLAAGLWLGTLPPFILLLAEARRTGDAEWEAVARTATRRYSKLAVASVTVLLAGGLVNTWFLAGTVPALAGTQYGRLLLAKIGLFIAMLLVAAVNLLRLTPRLAGRADGTRNVVWRTIGRLQSNARIEASLGLGVLVIVGALGTLPPGLHSEPGWPFPFRLDIGALTVGSQILLAILAVAICVCGAGVAAAAAAGRYRRSVFFGAGLVLCLAVGWLPLRPAIERAYPTSYYASAEPYAAASVVRGAAVYAENCALCHGATGRGDGPAAARLAIRPADLTEPHLFAHSPGDLFWYVGHGMDQGVMPGFAGVLNPNRRWDVINFIRARAAGALAMRVGPEVTAAAAPEVPDFAFEAGRVQQTLSEVLETAPVLLVLFAPPAPVERLRQLAAAQPRLGAAGLQIVAVGLGTSADETSEGNRTPPFVVGVSSAVSSALALSRAAE
ncbi:MAG: copper homeostasis membrane protein CopD, partial [Alphaproteobacteria bacterium]|nr:copper homeostasis membrane protein CopD [Alphaproteobacteria bacterium]